ncbi:hypothetical protein EG329_014215 [Mollisiaceae sp. DMI_Dod_QoI]|nr:hypothetical protein EG329_014215 [Helotiales sp. DMI_Dod_QoI]
MESDLSNTEDKGFYRQQAKEANSRAEEANLRVQELEERLQRMEQLLTEQIRTSVTLPPSSAPPAPSPLLPPILQTVERNSVSFGMDTPPETYSNFRIRDYPDPYFGGAFSRSQTGSQQPKAPNNRRKTPAANHRTPGPSKRSASQYPARINKLEPQTDYHGPKDPTQPAYPLEDFDDEPPAAYFNAPEPSSRAKEEA